MVDLSQKLRKFKMNLSGVKRKAVCVIVTQCHYTDCQKVWYDKIYKDKLPHKIVCPYCNRQQFDNLGDPVECNDMNYDSWQEWGLSRDIAADGRLGGSHQELRKTKTTWEEFEKLYGKQKF